VNIGKFLPEKSIIILDLVYITSYTYPAVKYYAFTSHIKRILPA
jgi:hypothetical protein